MKDLVEVMRVVQVFVFGGLGLVALYHWNKRRGAAEGWAAATFGSLALVVVLGRLVPSEHEPWVDWVRKFNVAVVVFFPYFLFRFTAAFRKPPRFIEAVALITTVGLAGGIFLFGTLPFPDEPRTSAYQTYVYLLLAQWSALSAYVAFRLWRGARGEPLVARRRMKTLALGAIGLALALVLVGLSSGAIGIQLVTQLIAMASAGLFLLGLFPPRAVRVSWRREEEEELRRAELKLMEVMQPSEVPQALLPRVSRLLGGKGSVLIGADGEVVACDGVDRTGASNIADEVVRSGGGEIRAPGGTILSVPLRPGWLAVEASRFTPFFGRDETEMLRSIALLAELALNRAELSQKQLHMQAQLVQAQAVAQIGSWEWDLGTNEISWSPQLYEIFGEDPETFTPDYDTLASRSHPEDREAVQKEAAAAIERGSTFETEYRVIRSDGDVITLHSQGKPILDGSGKVVRMVGILQDVSERRRQEQAREQFIANAAHELRTPLTSLLGFVEVLSTRRQMMSEEDIDQSYKVMERAGRRLAKLVSNLLDLTKVQQGHIELELIPVPLGVTVSEIVRGNPVPDGKHVDLDIPSDVMVLADPSRLGQIVLNLLSNAYKYGGPAITVSAVKQREAVLLSVTDDGPGVEPLLIEMLFEPFRRGEEVTRISGSGLGLAIVKMLVDASGGAVHYESVEPSGARFVVSLRRA